MINVCLCYLEGYIENYGFSATKAEGITKLKQGMLKSIISCNHIKKYETKNMDKNLLLLILATQQKGTLH